MMRFISHILVNAFLLWIVAQLVPGIHFDGSIGALLILGLIWAYLHHTFAGIRHLGLDLRLGIRLPGARFTAYAVLVLALGLTAIVGVLLW